MVVIKSEIQRLHDVAILSRCGHQVRHIVYDELIHVLRIAVLVTLYFVKPRARASASRCSREAAQESTFPSFS